MVKRPKRALTMSMGKLKTQNMTMKEILGKKIGHHVLLTWHKMEKNETKEIRNKK